MPILIVTFGTACDSLSQLLNAEIIGDNGDPYQFDLESPY